MYYYILFTILLSPGILGYPKDSCHKIPDDSVFDFVIIGGGSAGAVVANRLSEVSQLEILLIEAGHDPPLINEIPGFIGYPEEFMEWGYKSSAGSTQCLGMKNGQCDYHRAKTLGGCSVNNFMLYSRGNKIDYDNWGENWSYEEVLHFYKKSENYIATEIALNESKHTVSSKYHNRGGPLPITHFPLDIWSYNIRNRTFNALEGLGHHKVLDINGKCQIGFLNSQVTATEDSLRGHVAKAFLSSPNKNLKVCKDSLASTLILENNKVLGVKYIYNNVEKKVFAKFEVIISAGAFGSPMLLERSGIGNQHFLQSLNIEVKHNLPGVGENLQDHFWVTGNAFTLNANKRPFLPINFFGTILESLNGFVDTVNNGSVPDIQYQFAAFPRFSQIFLDFAFMLGRYLNYKETLIQKLMDAQHSRDILIIAPVLLQQNSRGRVHIVSKDLNEPPSIEPNYYANQTDIDTVIRGLQLAEKIIESDEYKPLEVSRVKFSECESFPDKSDGFYTCLMKTTATSIYHPSGTCKMGPSSDKMAVVDNSLKVHGLNNVRIIDASIMPVIVRGNTNGPTIMIGERGADLIKSSYHF